ncbi:MAG: MotA/TolQ/ExbB proton channel family protein [Deltaproteobacteria bacterium]|nr:MotA/TolQ/ExbB proton channel family protein [Deltaproteobacteria bacterium]
MSLILICLVIGLSFIIDRMVVLMGAGINKEEFVRTIQKHLFQGQLDQAIKVCSSYDKPMSRIVKAGLLRVKGTDAEVQAAMDEASLGELPKLEKRTGYLAMIGNITTLLGLVGTIAGLIDVFGGISGKNIQGAEKASILAGGIKEALNCTFFGLFVAVLALLFFAFLQGRTQALIDDINDASVRVLNLVVANRDKLRSAPAGDELVGIQGEPRA